MKMDVEVEDVMIPPTFDITLCLLFEVPFLRAMKAFFFVCDMG
jgi:hypothetical protein